MIGPSVANAWFDARAAPHNSVTEKSPIPGMSRSIMKRFIAVFPFLSKIASVAA